MAIVAQASAKRKEFFIGFSRVDADLKDHRVSGQLRVELIKRIMEGSNEQALSILNTVDIVGFVPGIGDVSIPINEFASFYGVTIEYLRSLLARNDLIQKNYPEDVKKCSTFDIIRAGALISPCCNQTASGSDEYVTYCLNTYGTPRVISLKRQRSYGMYSPRLVLATALLMCYTEKNDEGSNIKNVLLAIKRSLYRYKKVEDESSVDEVQEEHKTEDTAVQISGDGNLTMSTEVFAQMIKIAVKEAVAETLSAINNETVDDLDCRKMIKGNICDDNGTWVVRARIFDPITGKIKQRSKSTGFKVKDNTKHKAEKVMRKIIAEWEKEANELTRK